MLASTRKLQFDPWAELRRAARRSRHRAALARLGATPSQIALKAFAQEWKPMLASLLPIALLATWCWQRLEFLPPKAGEPVTFTATFPSSAAGQLAHLVPTEDLQAPQGWIRTVALETNTATAQATWTLTGTRGLHRRGQAVLLHCSVACHAGQGGYDLRCRLATRRHCGRSSESRRQRAEVESQRSEGGRRNDEEAK